MIHYPNGYYQIPICRDVPRDVVAKFWILITQWAVPVRDSLTLQGRRISFKVSVNHRPDMHMRRALHVVVAGEEQPEDDEFVGSFELEGQRYHVLLPKVA